ncbi:uncharacterized protein LOC110850569 [Folsomia candida]|uniref:DUF2975 domain-containing protein n=1 Tax=Folsomia candida TaxID=158441 RepID=A0A226EAI2_FOLCA|nr:uncharacterized protein LOC110850569 [Folsomia candida]OXA54420.1 hypothetical protein Fcan01_11881 [Folsomia candida]
MGDSKYNVVSKFVAILDLLLSIAILLWIGWNIFLGDEFLSLPSDGKKKKEQTDKIPMVVIPMLSLLIGGLGVIFAIKLLNATDSEVSGAMTQIHKRGTIRNWIKVSICICICILILVTIIAMISGGLSPTIVGGSVVAVLFKVFGISVVYLFYKDLEINSDIEGVE